MLILNDVGQVDNEAELWALDHFGKLARHDERCGPCDDDPEMTAPYIDGMPDGVHPDEFLSRPLKFEERSWAEQVAAQKAHDEAVLAELYNCDMDAMMRRRRAEIREELKRSKGRSFGKRNDHGFTKLGAYKGSTLTEEDKEFISSAW